MVSSTGMKLYKNVKLRYHGFLEVLLIWNIMQEHKANCTSIKWPFMNRNTLYVMRVLRNAILIQCLISLFFLVLLLLYCLLHLSLSNYQVTTFWQLVKFKADFIDFSQLNYFGVHVKISNTMQFLILTNQVLIQTEWKWKVWNCEQFRIYNLSMWLILVY